MPNIAVKHVRQAWNDGFAIALAYALGHRDDTAVLDISLQPDFMEMEFDEAMFRQALDEMNQDCKIMYAKVSPKIDGRNIDISLATTENNVSWDPTEHPDYT